MKDLVFLLIHLLTTLAKLLGPGGAKAIVADSLLMKQQLLVISRSRQCQRAPNLSGKARFLLGFWSLFLSPHHIRTHSSLGGEAPAEISEGISKFPIKLDDFIWQTHCKGLYQLPIAA